MNIGITQRILTYNNVNYDCLSSNWYTYLNKHTLWVIPNRLDQDFNRLSLSLDVLIISGGDNHPIRDQVEVTLTQLMHSLNKPIIGICHGLQFLTEYFGGSIAPVDNHRNIKHTVTYNTEVEVNSYHSNKIVKLPDGAISLAHDKDGNCEAWIMKNICGVMWHPERDLSLIHI